VFKREEKNAILEEFRCKFARARGAFVTGYRGIKANEMTELRRELRSAGVELRILRNTLLRLAAKDTPCAALSRYFDGPTAVALSYEDPVSTAKALIRFAKDQPLLTIRSGVLGGKLLEPAEIETLAQLPGRKELIAKLAGLMRNIPGSLGATLGGIQRRFIYALGAVGEAKGKQ
jgi:large subunit ribosomal protein L10